MKPTRPLATPLLMCGVVSLFLAVFAFAQPAGNFPPDVTTGSAAAVAASTATLGGSVDYLGDTPVTSRGVVYSITAVNASPTIGGTGAILAAASGNANTLGSFTVDVTGLQSATQYSFVAYATNGFGTSYGTTVVTFTTLSEPTVTSPTSASITSTAATLGGDVSSDGGYAITERGVVYSATSLNGDPLVGGANVVKLVASGTTGVFTVPATGLTPGVQYSFKAFATNGVGTAYSASDTFTTLDVPSLGATPTVASVTTSGATLGGNVTSDGLDAITARGVVYSASSANSSPQIGGSGVTTATTTGTTGAFTIGVTGLSSGTTYSFAAYATNGVGTTYSNFGSFETVAGTPVVVSPTQSSVTTDPLTAISSATLGGNVTVPGSETIERGVVYSLTSANGNPVIGGAGVTTKVHANTAGTTGVFTVDLDNLQPYSSYTYKAYVKNSAGTVTYTAADLFTTPAVAPVVNGGTTVVSVTSSSATLGGSVTKTGGRPLLEVGIVYSVTSVNGNPLLDGPTVTKLTTTAATGVFSIPVSGLSAGTRYSFRAFATSAAGTRYSSATTFTTTTTSPVIQSPTKTSIALSSATLGGDVTDDGGLTISERGVVYALTSTNANPRIGGTGVTKITSAGATGVFTASVSGLEPGSGYSFAAYAKNSSGTSYTSVVTFTTASEAPTVTTPSVGSIASTKATLGGNVSDANGSEISERGVVYALASANSTPALGGTGVSKAVAGGTTGEFTIAVTGLSPGRKYTFAAYAKSNKGTAYSYTASFTTDPGVPTVDTPTASQVESNKARLGGNVSKTGGASITERGVVYSIQSLNPDPLVGGSAVVKVEVSGSTGLFSVPTSSLQAGTTYVFRAYAKNRAGNGYSDAVTFTTLPGLPTVASTTKSDVATTTATLGGTVADDGGSDITEIGVVYSLAYINSKPRIDGTGVRKVTAKPGVGAFEVLVANLRGGRQYVFAAYARNSKGIRYSALSYFNTKPGVPTVMSPSKDKVLADSAILGGRVSQDNGSRVLERGVIYSTSKADLTLESTRVSKMTVSGTTGRFSIPVTRLVPGIRYFFKAFARNKLGVEYSELASFTTKQATTVLASGLSAPKAGSVESYSGDALDLIQTYYTLDSSSGFKYLTISVVKASGTEQQDRLVEVSGNLTDWFSGDAHTTVLSDDGGVLTVRDNTPNTPDKKRYIRVRSVR